MSSWQLQEKKLNEGEKTAEETASVLKIDLILAIYIY